eukprot:6697874-Prymnesium_polylepis.1
MFLNTKRTLGPKVNVVLLYWHCSGVPALSAALGETAVRAPASRTAVESFASMTVTLAASRPPAAGL